MANSETMAVLDVTPLDTVLALVRVCAGYKAVPVLRDVTFNLSAGEVLAILGRNGAGKTTLLKTIMGLIRLTGGDVVLDGERSLRPLSPDRIATIGIGYVPQGRGIFRSLSVMENLQVPQFAHRIGSQRIEELIESFPALKPHLDRSASGLSGGQQQILALARALVTRPKVLLLDEPSEGIQPSILDEILEALSALREREKISILLVEQNLDFAGHLADRGYVMETGRIVRELDRNSLQSTDALARDLMITQS